MKQIKGSVILLGDDIDTDQILPGYAMAEPMEKLGDFAMAGLIGLDFASVFKKGNILVAGRNFGCGSSREQAPIALKQAGVSLIVATGFARIFRRNAINIGLPVWVADVRDKVEMGEIAEVDLAAGKFMVGSRIIQAPPPSDVVMQTLAHGGLVPRVRAELGIKE